MAWVASAWVDLNTKKESVATISERIEEKQSQLEQAQVAVEKYAESKANLDKAKRILDFRRGEKFTAQRKLGELESRCGPAHPLCAPWILDQIAAARVQVATKTARHKIALTKYGLLVDAANAESVVFGEIAELEKDIDMLQRQKDTLEEIIDTTPVNRILSIAERQLAAAIVIVLCIIFVPYLLRTFLFFVVAPLLRFIEPITIAPLSTGMIKHEESQVSIPVVISAGKELLVRQSALQTLSTGSDKRTRWFLNSHLPFSSLASGMYALTSVRCTNDDNETVTVSLDDDVFSSLCSLRLPIGSSLVLKPHTIVGVLKDADQEIRIQRNWRIFSLHSWLTFQFRYLVFHGPCDIIVQGCRGVRVEQSRAETGRLLSPQSTIGFSPDVEYSNQRVETFMPYLFGYETLLKDRFTGAGGVYLYEETIDPRRKKGIAGRGLEGFLEGVLNAFGI